MDDDPEKRRIDELIVRVSRDQASEAEREELALYAADDPDIERRVRGEARVADLGDGWLDRVEADRRLQRRESTRFVRVERGVGLAAVGAGVALGFLGSTLAPVAVIGGVGLLTWSFIRVRLHTFKDDPYKDIHE